MTDYHTLTEACQLITDLLLKLEQNKESPDLLTLKKTCQDCLDLLNQNQVSNKTYMGLEKFYQKSSFLIGLGQIKLSPSAYQACRAYDRFHFEEVKPKLKVYGVTWL